MDVVRDGLGLVIAIRSVIGWVSWFIVAMHLYESMWWSVDGDSYFVLPMGFYQWLDDLVEPASQETSSDLDAYSTSAVMVLGLHFFTGVIVCLLKRMGLWRRVDGSRWRRNIPSVLGWSSWLLVLTFTLLTACDALLRARGNQLPGGTVAQVVELIGGLLFVGFLHLAVVKTARSQRT